MRIWISNLVALSMFALLAFVSTGCQNTTPGSATAMADSGRRAVLITGNGGSTTVYIPTDDPEHPMMLSTAGAQTCSECQAAAVKYFHTGELDPKCAKCGATRTLLNPGTPNVGHQ